MSQLLAIIVFKERGLGSITSCTHCLTQYGRYPPGVSASESLQRLRYATLLTRKPADYSGFSIAVGQLLPNRLPHASGTVACTTPASPDHSFRKMSSTYLSAILSCLSPQTKTSFCAKANNAWARLRSRKWQLARESNPSFRFQRPASQTA